MPVKYLVISLVAVALSFIGGFLIANALNRAEIEAMRRENDGLKNAANSAADSPDAALSVEAIREKLDEVAEQLPPNVQVTPVYDRTSLVDKTLATVRLNLTEGALLGHQEQVLARFRQRFRAWLVRMTWRLALNRQRSNRRRQVRDDHAAPPPDSGTPVEADLQGLRRVTRPVDLDDRGVAHSAYLSDTRDAVDALAAQQILETWLARRARS